MPYLDEAVGPWVHPCSSQAELSRMTSSEPASLYFLPLEGSLSMMVPAKPLQIHTSLPSAEPSLPLHRVLTLSTQVPTILSVLGHPLPRQSAPHALLALGRACN